MAIPFQGIPLSAVAFVVIWALSLLVLSLGRRSGPTEVTRVQRARRIAISGVVLLLAATGLAARWRSAVLAERAASLGSPAALREHSATLWARYDARVSLALAYNRNSPADLLRELSAHRSRRVRSAVAAHGACPADVLAQLSGDSAYEVRWFVAGNGNTPPQALLTLGEEVKTSPRSDLAWAVARNPSTPQNVLRELSRMRGRPQGGVAGNPAAPSDLLEEFAASKDPSVRLAVARNRAASLGLLERLARDRSGREEARRGDGWRRAPADSRNNGRVRQWHSDRPPTVALARAVTSSASERDGPTLPLRLL